MAVENEKKPQSAQTEPSPRRRRGFLRTVAIAALLTFACLAMLGVIAVVSINDRSDVQYAAAAVGSILPEGAVSEWLRQVHPDTDGEACIGRLKTLDVAFSPLADFREGKSCVVKNPVRVSRFGEIALSSPIMMTCGMAERMNAWITGAAQPAAQRLRGSALTELKKIGGYSCRSMRGNTNRLSEHGKANAIDIGVFTFEDGTAVSVAQDWDSTGTGGSFLREVASDACAFFRVVLTPDHDANHQAHFHFDAGPWRLCGVNRKRAVGDADPNS